MAPQALTQRVGALGRTLRNAATGTGAAREAAVAAEAAEEGGASWEGEADPEEAALLKLETDLLAAEAAASDLLDRQVTELLEDTLTLTLALDLNPSPSRSPNPGDCAAGG